MFGRSNADEHGNGTESNGRGVGRRTFMSGVGAASGLGALAGRGGARPGRGPGDSGATYYVSRTNGKYRVTSGHGGGVAFQTRAAQNAERAFQYAFDELNDGGTVVASADTFEFGAPATVGDGTAVVGSQGTRFVASTIGRSDDPYPTTEQQNPLPVGTDVLRLRGDDVAVTGIEFDAAGTQLENHAIQADGCDGVLIANNRTVNGFQMAISFTRCSNVVVRGNDVLDPNWYGITGRAAPAGGDLDLRQSTNVVVAGNRVAGMKFNNVATYNVSNFAVVNNLVADGGHSLIACSPAQQGAIVGNVCRDLDRFGGDPGGEAGIEVEYKETHVSEAVAGTPEDTSFDVTVSGNQVDDCEVGFVARTVPADPSDAETARREKRPYAVTVTGNSFANCEDAGIRVRSGESVVIATNALRNNGTHVDVDEDYTEDVERGLNVTHD